MPIDQVTIDDVRNNRSYTVPPSRHCMWKCEINAIDPTPSRIDSCTCAFCLREAGTRDLLMLLCQGYIAGLTHAHAH